MLVKIGCSSIFVLNNGSSAVKLGYHKHVGIYKINDDISTNTQAYVHVAIPRCIVRTCIIISIRWVDAVCVDITISNNVSTFVSMD